MNGMYPGAGKVATCSLLDVLEAIAIELSDLLGLWDKYTVRLGGTLNRFIKRLDDFIKKVNLISAAGLQEGFTFCHSLLPLGFPSSHHGATAPADASLASFPLRI